MAEASKDTKIIREDTVTLVLTGGEAGCLLDLLAAHVAGPVAVDSGGELYEVRAALERAKVARVFLSNRNLPSPKCAHVWSYAVLHHLPAAL